MFKRGDAPHVNNIELGRFGRNRTNVWDYPGQNLLNGTSPHGQASRPCGRCDSGLFEPQRRHFGDDVVNIALIALGAAGPFGSIDPNYNGTRVDHNDETYNRVFPYAGTPHNGRKIAPPNPRDY